MVFAVGGAMWTSRPTVLGPCWFAVGGRPGTGAHTCQHNTVGVVKSSESLVEISDFGIFFDFSA